MSWLLIAALLSLLPALLAGFLIYGVSELTKPGRPDPKGCPSDYGLPYSEVPFKSRDGLNLHGWFIPVEQTSAEEWSKGAKGTVIFCHGRFGSKDPDLEYAPAFHQAGYNVFLFDFRGHGRSEGTYSSFGYYERLDLLGAIDLLKSKGMSRFGVLGFSLGGAVGISTAGECQDIVAVVSDGGFVELRHAVTLGAKERGVPGPVASLFARAVLWLAGLRLGCRLEEADPIRWASRISPRALFLIHGAKDPFVPTADVIHLYHVAGEPKEIWIATRMGHREVDKAQPRRYRGSLMDFFDRYLAHVD